MSRLERIQHAVATWEEADTYFDALATYAWPYVWCWQDVRNNEWKVTTFVDTHYWLAA